MAEFRARQRGVNTEVVPVFDAWTSVSFKSAVGEGTSRNGGTPDTGWGIAPTWVGDHRRRLQAYIVLQAFIDNAARYFLTDATPLEKQQHREYGDASLLVEQIRGSLMGHSQAIVVEGAADFQEELPPEATEEEKKRSADAKPAHDLQTFYRDWATKERFAAKNIECERDAVGLGDGVYVLTWSGKKKRVRCQVYDPGFYFPVLEDGSPDYPTKVHIAWELPPDTDTPGRRKIRRKTWELRNMPDGATRSYPWNNGARSTEACYFTDAIWTIDQAQNEVETLRNATPEYVRNADGQECRDLDLQIDFVPVVHVPNTVAEKNHFGKSSIASILQALDDLANADTDLSLASATTGTPPIALSGARFGETKPEYAPGKVWELGENGKLSQLDTSPALKALADYIDFLLKRISVNGRIPEALLGRVDLTGNLAGITVRLTFGPLESMVGEMRLVRAEKNPLLLKFVHRMSVAGRAEKVPAEFVDGDIEYGSFLPQDESGTAELAVKLLAGKVISLETAVGMMLEVGIPIEDIQEEILRIQHRDFEGADLLLTALGNEEEVFKYLGRKFDAAAAAAAQQAAAGPTGAARPAPPGAPPPPPVNLPNPPNPAGGGGAQPPAQ